MQAQGEPGRSAVSLNEQLQHIQDEFLHKVQVLLQQIGGVHRLHGNDEVMQSSDLYDTESIPNEQLLYQAEYAAQFDAYNKTLGIDRLVRRRKQFIELARDICSGTEAYYGTIRIDDTLSSCKRKFDINYIFNKRNSQTVQDSFAKNLNAAKTISQPHTSSEPDHIRLNVNTTYTTCVNVLSDYEELTDNENFTSILTVMVKTHLEMFQHKSGIMFVTPGLNSPTMQILGTVVQSFQKFITVDSFQCDPLIKVVGMAQVNEEISKQLSVNSKTRISLNQNKTDLNADHTDYFIVSTNSEVIQDVVFQEQVVGVRVVSIVLVLGGERSMLIRRLEQLLTNSSCHVFIVNQNGNHSQATSLLADVYQARINFTLKYKLAELNMFHALCIRFSERISVVNTNGSDNWIEAFTASLYSVYFKYLGIEKIALLQHGNVEMLKYLVLSARPSVKPMFYDVVVHSDFNLLFDQLKSEVPKNYVTALKQNATAYPCEVLFQWAILAEKHDVADFLFEHCDNKLAASLMACKLYTIIQSKHKSGSKKRQHKQQQHVKYEKIAVGIMEQAYSTCEAYTLTNLLLQQQHPLISWDLKSDLSCLDVAMMTECELFVSHNACTDYVTQRWWGPEEGLCNFYYPSFKHTISFICLILLTTFYSYLILTTAPSNFEIHWTEYLCFAWIALLLFEEVYIKIKIRRKEHFFTLKILCLLMFVLAICGFILRLAISNARLKYSRKLELSAYCCYLIGGIALYYMVFRTLMAFDWIGLYLIMLRKMFTDMITVCLIITVYMAMFGFLYSMFSWDENIAEENPFLKPAMVFGQPLYDYSDIAQPQASCFGNFSNVTVANLNAAFLADYSTCLFFKGVDYVFNYFFTFFVNILLINFSIASFSNIYDKTMQKSQVYRNTLLWKLLEEHKHRPILPAPFSFIEIMVRVCINETAQRTHKKVGVITVDEYNGIEMVKESSSVNGCQVTTHSNKSCLSTYAVKYDEEHIDTLLQRYRKADEHELRKVDIEKDLVVFQEHCYKLYLNENTAVTT